MMDVDPLVCLVVVVNLSVESDAVSYLVVELAIGLVLGSSEVLVVLIPVVFVALGIAKNYCYFLYFNFIFVVVLLGSFLLQFILSFSHIFSLYLSVESILKTKVLNSFPISEL